jgi:hypothetical protein
MNTAIEPELLGWLSNYYLLEELHCGVIQSADVREFVVSIRT